MSAALGIPPNVLVADLREWPEGEDEAPRLTIQGVRSCAGAGGPPPKSLDSDEIFLANLDLSLFTHFLEIFGQKKCFFGSKTVFLGQEVHYYMVYIAYFTELILQICDYAQKQRN